MSDYDWAVQLRDAERKWFASNRVIADRERELAAANQQIDALRAERDELKGHVRAAERGGERLAKEHANCAHWRAECEKARGELAALRQSTEADVSRDQPVSAVHVHPRYLGSPAVARAWDGWSERLTSWSPLHGVDLVEAIAGSDSVAAAEDLLRVAEDAGVIIRAAFEPRPSQRFLGIGGTTLDHVRKTESMRHVHTSLWSWVKP